MRQLCVVSLCACVAWFSSAARSQCAPEWIQAPGGLGGTNGDVHCATIWDPDGPGPRASVVVVGGTFTLAGSGTAMNIAVYDPESRDFAALGQGIAGSVFALVSSPAGDLFAGGRFSAAGSVLASNVARWNGSSWVPLGTGIAGGAFSRVDGLAIDASGILYAGGTFSIAGGVQAASIAKWSNNTWSSLGTGVDGPIASVVSIGGSGIVAGGSFTTAGGSGVNNVARWNGTAWQAMDNANNLPYVRSLAISSDGSIFAAAGPGVYRWNGQSQSWQSAGCGAGNGSILSLVADYNSVIAGGNFYPDGGSGYIIDCGGTRANFDGLLSGQVAAMVRLPNGNIFAAGGISGCRSEDGPWEGAEKTAVWDGSSWGQTGRGLDDAAYTVLQRSNGTLVFGGRFVRAGSLHVNGIVGWNGTEFSSLGTGVRSISSFDAGYINSILEMPNGDLVVGGYFSSAGGVTVNNIARWNGTAWSAYGGGLIDGQVRGLARMTDGSLVATGDFSQIGGMTLNRIARWNGSAWLPLGGGAGGAAVCALPNNQLLAAGTTVRRWNGSGWQAVGFPGESVAGSYVTAMHVLNNGNVLIASRHPNFNNTYLERVVEWNGSQWSLFDVFPTQINSLGQLAGGDYLAATSSFAPQGGIFRRQNGVWGLVPGSPYGVHGLSRSAVGFACAGYFGSVEGNPSPFIAEYNILGSCTCDSIDFNGDGLFPDTQDIDDFVRVFAGGVCTPPAVPNCNTDLDFNNDGLFPDTLDIDSFLSVFAGGACL
jgi:trimeric autotransporter adhesin